MPLNQPARTQDILKYDVGMNAALIALLGPLVFIALILTQHFGAHDVQWLDIVGGTIAWWVIAVVLFLTVRSCAKALLDGSNHATAGALTAAPVVGHLLGCVVAFRLAASSASHWLIAAVITAGVLVCLELAMTTPWKNGKDEDIEELLERFHV